MARENSRPMRLHPHPGKILKESVFEPLSLPVSRAAKMLGMSRVALSRVVNEHAGISTDLAVRLEKAGVSTARAWLSLQTNYELAKALQKVRGLKVERLQAEDVEVA